jgi:hypothetical protein
MPNTPEKKIIQKSEEKNVDKPQNVKIENKISKTDVSNESKKQANSDVENKEELKINKAEVPKINSFDNANQNKEKVLERIKEIQKEKKNKIKS